MTLDSKTTQVVAYTPTVHSHFRGYIYATILLCRPLLQLVSVLFLVNLL